jgi:ParB/RepB/Spo0J family partition protein
MTELTTIALDLITAGNNDRKRFDENELRELADSIAANGLLQPPTVVADGNSGYRIVAGERRTRACRLLGWSEISVLVREMTVEEEAAAMLIENISRVDLDPMAEARAYRSRIDQFGETVESLAKATGKSRKHVEKRLGLLDLIDDVQVMVASGNLDIRLAECMVGLGGYRQTLAIKVLNESGRTPTLREFRKVCGELQAEQDQAALFDLADFWQEQLQEAKPAARKQLPRRADLPEPKQCYRKDRYLANSMVDYARELEADGFAAEASAILHMVDHLVEHKRLDVATERL